MSNRPYNDSVECDKEFQQKELTCQMNLALRTGMYWFNATGAFVRAFSSKQPGTAINDAIR